MLSLEVRNSSPMFFCDSQIVPFCTRTSTPSPPVW